MQAIGAVAFFGDEGDEESLFDRIFGDDEPGKSGEYTIKMGTREEFKATEAEPKTAFWVVPDGPVYRAVDDEDSLITGKSKWKQIPSTGANPEYESVTTGNLSSASITEDYHVTTDGTEIDAIPQTEGMQEYTGETDIGLLLEKLVENELPPKGSRKQARGHIRLGPGNFPGDLSSPAAGGTILPMHCRISGELPSHHRVGSTSSAIPSTEPPTLLNFSGDGFITPNADTDAVIYPIVEDIELWPTGNPSGIAFNDVGGGSNEWDWLYVNRVAIGGKHEAPFNLPPNKGDRPVIVTDCNIRNCTTVWEVPSSVELHRTLVSVTDSGQIEITGNGKMVGGRVVGSGENGPVAQVYDRGLIRDALIQKSGGTDGNGVGVDVWGSGRVISCTSRGSSGSFDRVVQLQGSGEHPVCRDLVCRDTPNTAVNLFGGNGVEKPEVQGVTAPGATNKIGLQSSPNRPIINGTCELGGSPSGTNWDSAYAGIKILDTSVSPPDVYYVAQDGTLYGPV